MNRDSHMYALYRIKWGGIWGMIQRKVGQASGQVLAPSPPAVLWYETLKPEKIIQVS